jgi:CheY-like chemotaxis protein
MDEKIKPNILLVEDTRIAAIVASSLLTSAGCLVDIAETGTDALKLVSQKKYDLILMDIGLPDIDGIAVTKQIKEQETVKHIPIIALTAHDKEELKQKCLDVGMEKVLPKPLTAEQVNNLLNTYLKK